MLIYVTGFWKTDQIVTLGLFHFIGLANGYTCTLHIHSTVTRPGGLVCFSRASFPVIQYIWRGYSLELQWLEYLKSVFLEILNMTTWSVFQNQVTYII